MTILRTIGMQAPDPLQNIFAGDLERCSLLEDRFGECSQVTFWFRARKNGVAVWNEMHNVAERLEVGVLNVRSVEADPDSSFEAFPKPGTPRIESFVPPLQITALWKLCVQEQEVKCESGMRMLLSDGSDFSILPSASPCHIVLLRSGHPLTAQTTEYGFEDYLQERVY